MCVCVCVRVCVRACVRASFLLLLLFLFLFFLFLFLPGCSHPRMRRRFDQRVEEWMECSITSLSQDRMSFVMGKSLRSGTPAG